MPSLSASGKRGGAQAVMLEARVLGVMQHHKLSVSGFPLGLGNVSTAGR